MTEREHFTEDDACLHVYPSGARCHHVYPSGARCHHVAGTGGFCTLHEPSGRENCRGCGGAMDSDTVKTYEARFGPDEASAGPWERVRYCDECAELARTNFNGDTAAFRDCGASDDPRQYIGRQSPPMPRRPS